MAAVTGGDPNKTKLVTRVVEPAKTLVRNIYHCGKTFETSLLKEGLQQSRRYGFVIVGGSSADYYVVSGTQKDKLFSYGDPSLPGKHNKGGQSSNRFSRIREEKRDVYVKKLAEHLTYYFIDRNTNKVNVEGVVFAGSGDIKNQILKHRDTDKRIISKVIGVVDIQGGGFSGLSEALSKTSSLLDGFEYAIERDLISNFMRRLDTDAYSLQTACFGLLDVDYVVNSGLAETLLIWDKIKGYVYSYQHKSTKENKRSFVRMRKSDDWSLISEEDLFDWLLDNSSNLGIELKIVTDNTPEGRQFAAAFGGIGALLRYGVRDLPSMKEGDSDLNYDFDCE